MLCLLAGMKVILSTILNVEYKLRAVQFWGGQGSRKEAILYFKHLHFENYICHMLGTWNC